MKLPSYEMRSVPSRSLSLPQLQGEKEIRGKINKIMRKLAEANNLRGVIDVRDFNDENRFSPARYSESGRQKDLGPTTQGTVKGASRYAMCG